MYHENLLSMIIQFRLENSFCNIDLDSWWPILKINFNFHFYSIIRYEKKLAIIWINIECFLFFASIIFHHVHYGVIIEIAYISFYWWTFALVCCGCCVLGPFAMVCCVLRYTTWISFINIKTCCMHQIFTQILHHVSCLVKVVVMLK